MKTIAVNSSEQVEMRQVMIRVVLRFLPVMLFMYMLAFLDRANIGFAQAAIQSDAGLSTADFAFGSGLFFLGYALSEIPSNIVLARVGARRWLSWTMVVFGIIAAATAFFHGRDSFFLLRVLLGAAEGGLYPGLILFLTYWIPTAHWVRVMGIFIFGAPLALIFGSPFTGLLLSFDGLWGLHGWQIMFLITGAATAAAGIWIQFYFDNAPAEARFLTPPARKLLVEELARNAREREKFSPRGMLRMFVDWRVLYCIVVYFAIQVGIFAVVFYLPSLWGSLTGRRTGVISGLEIAIPWLVSILAIVLVTRIADRGTSKALLGFACLGLAGAGLFCGSLSSTPLIALCGFTVAAAGLMSVQPVFWSWPRAMLSGSAATAGIAFINALGNLGGFAAPNVKTWADVTARNSVAGLVTLSAITMAGALLLLGAGRMERLNPGS